jgi:hypothetical protein
MVNEESPPTKIQGLPTVHNHAWAPRGDWKGKWASRKGLQG